MKIFSKQLGKAESTTVEWKQSLSEIKEIIETVAYFANTQGGRILIGVSPEGRITGIHTGKGSVEKLVNQIAQNTDPKIHPKVTTKKIGDKDIMVVEVRESRDHLVLAYGRPYKRVGRSSVRMSKDEYEGLILEKNRKMQPFDAEVCKGSTFSDIDAGKVKHFLSSAKQERRLDINPKGSLKGILMQLKLLKNGRPTNAAIILFGKDPGRLFEQSEVKCVRFKGIDVVGEMIDLKPLSGDAINIVKEAEKFIYDHIPLRAWIASGKLERQEKWLYPPKAIREALVNAIAHRDYQTTSKVQVRIFDDRIEFWNPGHLPQGWTPETLKERHESKPPNPAIAKAFYWIRYAEEVGTGTNKIILWCREWGLPDPEFQCAGSSLVVTFKGGEVKAEVKSPKDAVLLEGLNGTQRKMVEYLSQQGQVSTQQFVEFLGISRTAVKNNLKSMKRIVKWEGKTLTDPQGKYVLK